MEFPGDFLSTIIEEMRVTCKASEILESGHGIVVLKPSVRSHAETFWMISAGYGQLDMDGNYVFKALLSRADPKVRLVIKNPGFRGALIRILSF